VDYGFQMEMVGDKCFITNVRPGHDAAQKLHPGDQVLSLGTYAVNRKDLWQIQYYLYQIAPQPATAFLLRDPSGNERRETVLTKYNVRKRLNDDPNDFIRLEMEDERMARLSKIRSQEIGEALIWKLLGVTPDVTVLPTASDLAEGRDPALAKAAELGGLKLDPIAAGKMFPFEWVPD